VLLSSTGFDYTRPLSRTWGVNGDTPVVADIDGNGSADLTVWRPSTSQWWALLSMTGFDYTRPFTRLWGVPGDVPIGGSLFDAPALIADGLTELTIYRPSPSGSNWWLLHSFRGYDYGFAFNRIWGVTGDVPLGQ
jgi:hypothetical protein